MNSNTHQSCDGHHILPSPKLSQHIAIVATRTDGMTETGFGSMNSCRILCDLLQKRYTCVTFHEITTFNDLERVSEQKPDLVILCQKYFHEQKDGEKIWFSDYFARNHINFTGSLRKSLIYDSDKSMAKTVVSNSGILTAKFFLTSPDQIEEDYQLPLDFPLFIKPKNAANSFGVDENSIVYDIGSFNKKVRELSANHRGKIMAEEYLPGREFTVAVFNDDSTEEKWLFPLEIEVEKNKSGHRIVDHKVKNQNTEKLKPVTEPLSAQLNWLASRIFKILNARDFARVDFRIDHTGALNFLEINLAPGMTHGSSYFPKACAIHNSYSAKDNPKHGLKYIDVIYRIAEIGLNRRQV